MYDVVSQQRLHVVEADVGLPFRWTLFFSFGLLRYFVYLGIWV